MLYFKKRKIFINSFNSKAFFILGILFALTFTILLFSYISIPSDIKMLPVMSIPVSNKVIVLDAGHGIPDKGAENRDGISEEKINLQIALCLQNLLENSGATVLLTRSDENGIYSEDSNSISHKKVSDMKNRVKIGNESSADLFVSIHLNNFSNCKYYGCQTFYREGDEDSKKLATYIQKNLNESISNENQRTIHTLNDIYLMKNVNIPITLVECGFLSNPQESKLLQDPSYQLKLAWGIYDGIMDYFTY